MNQLTVREFCASGTFMVAHVRGDHPLETIVAVDGELIEAKVAITFDDQDRYRKVVIEPTYPKEAKAK